MSKLSLYGYAINEIQEVVESFISDQILFGEDKLEIMTGSNPHVKNIVKDIVENYGFHYKEHFYNKQVLIISI